MTERLKEFLTAPDRKRRILALDGGGVRGFLTLGVLQELEKELVRRSGDPDYRLSQYFDLIGGTSTGSIIATGLALGWKVDRVWDAYKKIVPRVFGAWFKAFGFLAPMYSERPLLRALQSFFHDETLGSQELETGLAIFAKSMSTGSAWELCNNPGWCYYGGHDATDRHRANSDIALRSIVQASAAAPHYFRGIKIQIERDGAENERNYFIDGGVGGFNNPAMELLTMVRDPEYGFEWKLGVDDLYVLSIGTGWMREQTRPWLGRDFTDSVFALQTVKALAGMINDVSLQQIAYLQAMSRVAMPWYINGEKKFQGGTATQGGKAYLSLHDDPIMTYQRVDVRLVSREETFKLGDRRVTLPDAAEAFLDDIEAERASDPKRKRERPRTAITDAEIKGLLRIDNSARANSDLLSQLGRAAGRRAMHLAAPPASFDRGGANDPWNRPNGQGSMRNAHH